ncbi:MAG: hypothetical protein DCC57_09980 [Chloroflexi bacterium]|nr:MAG: hypothetical protein DCC57_09980 [Chloroflexota bacterium]
MQEPYSLTRDPLYYFTVGFFALLTTALPALLGQPRFLPLIQALALTVFMAIPLQKGHLRGAINVMVLWLLLQYTLIALLTWGFGGYVERAIDDGFVYRGELASWFYDETVLPGGLQAAPIARLIEILGIILGSLLTAGLVGAWFLVRAVDLAGFGTGALLTSLDTPALILRVIPLWSLVRIAGYAGLVILLAEPLLANRWSLTHLLTQRRQLLWISLGLVVGGLLLELVLPGLMARAA